MTLRLLSDALDDDGHRPGAEHDEVKKVLAALNHVPTRRSTYLRTARRAVNRSGAFLLSHVEVRMLWALAEWADRDLSNCFPGVGVLARVDGFGHEHAKKLLKSLTAKGWIRSRPILYRGQRASGRQFMIPPGVLAPWADEWAGPRDFSKTTAG